MRGHRRFLSLVGEREWALTQVQRFANLSVNLPSSLSELDAVGRRYTAGTAHQSLGGELDLLFVDLSDSFHANALTALCGCVRSGGLVVIYWGLDLDCHPIEETLRVEGFEDSHISNYLRQRFQDECLAPPHALHTQETGSFDTGGWSLAPKG